MFTAIVEGGLGSNVGNGEVELGGNWEVEGLRVRGKRRSLKFSSFEKLFFL